jgi:hypothetical protein
MTQARPRVMATNMTPVELSDGRIVKVSEYPGGSVRIAISGSEGFRYALTELFIPGVGKDMNVKFELL